MILQEKTAKRRREKKKRKRKKKKKKMESRSRGERRRKNNNKKVLFNIWYTHASLKSSMVAEHTLMWFPRRRNILKV